jgi:hypothetical protein
MEADTKVVSCGSLDAHSQAKLKVLMGEDADEDADEEGAWMLLSDD